MNVTVGIIVSDDDTTMKARLKHSWKEMIEKGIMSKQDWPKTDKGTYKKDNGQLPLHISPPNFSADPNHRKKSLASCYM